MAKYAMTRCMFCGGLVRVPRPITSLGWACVACKITPVPETDPTRARGLLLLRALP